uniref:Iodothyronine deiodinase n=1 Tax=Dromaius novaehollandiae TaxID=8790 RepID=A0A8C4PBP3_DRONO
MGLLSVDLLITLQILPVFFSNCLFLALYDSVLLLKHMVLFLSRSKAARGEWRRMLTSEGLRCHPGKTGQRNNEPFFPS